MHERTLVPVLITVLMASTHVKILESGQQQHVLEATVDQVLVEVQKALVDVQTKLADKTLPELESVTLSLQTVVTKNGGPKIKFLIFSFGRDVEKERSQLMELKLVPPKPHTPVDIAAGPSISEELVDAILQAAEGVREAENGKPPLTLNTLKVELSFVVKESVNAGVKFEIAPITVELGGNLQKKAIHKVTIVFKA